MGKQLLTIESDGEREERLKHHAKVGKTYKTQVVDRERTVEEIESELVSQALKLPNRTHIDSPVGSEDRNKVVFEGGPQISTKHK